MKNVKRVGVFETNSSSEHSISINFNGYCSLDEEFSEWTEGFDVDDSEIEYILENLPIEMIEKELNRRKNEEASQKQSF